MEAAADTVGGGGVAGLCLGWVAVWCAGHYVFWRLNAFALPSAHASHIDCVCNGPQTFESPMHGFQHTCERTVQHASCYGTELVQGVPMRPRPCGVVFWRPFS